MHTCSGVTGFCDVLCSSSIVFWSYLKSFLQPTRMMGRPEQKCRTSEIHWGRHIQSVFVRRVGVSHMMQWQHGHVSGWFTFSWTLSNESGESTAKQMRMTCESG